MQADANKILDIFNLKSNINLTDGERLVLIEKVLQQVYSEGKRNGALQTISKLNQFQTDLMSNLPS